MDMPTYSYSLFWSDEDDEYVATCGDVPGLSGLAPTPEEALAELKVALGGWLAYLRDKGLEPPPARRPAGGHLIVFSPGLAAPRPGSPRSISQSEIINLPLLNVALVRS